MNGQELIDLREEWAQQRQIISVLLEQNAQLKEDNSQMADAIEKIREYVSHIEVVDGKRITELSQIADKNRKYKKYVSNILNEKGNDSSDISHYDTKTGNPISDSSQKKPSLNKQNIELLATKVPYRGRKSGRKTIASILLHLLNDGGGAHSTLKGVTNLTDSGIAKTIYYMKQRGLIERNGFQRFKLTAKSLDWIEQSGVK